MEDRVIFDLPGHAEAVALGQELGLTRLWLIDHDDGFWCVQAVLEPDSADFAQLLRTVERFVAESGLLALRFHVDGRSYLLVSRVRDAAGA